MSDETKKGRPAGQQKTAAEVRLEKRAAALRANLAKRKQQTRARRAGDEDERDGRLMGSGPDGEPEKD